MRARHGSYLAGGRQDAPLEAAARADVAACRQADPTLAPDAGYFSPSFMAYFAGR